jgi:hypothetical protein
MAASPPPRSVAWAGQATALFAWLISHQQAVLFSQKQISNQQTVLFSQNKPAPGISQAGYPHR